MNQTTEAPAEFEPEITQITFLSMQVCVPGNFTDEQVEDFANTAEPPGTTNGWQIRKEGEPSLNGDPERAACIERQGCVHIVLDC